MPTLGWLLGSQFQSYITAIDHWIAFILLALIGGKMILDVIKERGENEEVCPDDSVRIDLKEFFLLAVATSIDALAVGITFAFLQVKLISSVTVIGCITFCLSLIHIWTGAGQHFYGYFSGCGQDRNGFREKTDLRDRRETEALSGEKYRGGSGDGSHQRGAAHQ